MPLEIEAKYRLDDPDAVRDRLRACGVRRIGAVLETNYYFDRPDGGMRWADCGLRIRVAESAEPGVAAPKVTVTYKGPRKPGPLKVREEIEFAADDADAAAAVLEALGLVRALSFQKRRESWRMESCEIVLDELPYLGHFAEIEGPDEAAVMAVAGRLGLSDLPLERTAYSTLISAYRDEANLAPGLIAF